MTPVANESIENKFSSLSAEEKVSVISHGVALRLSEWKKRLFLAESKVRYFEEKYLTSLTELDTKGLPNDANHEMHEDYIMWHHRTDAVEMESFPQHKHVEQRGNLQPSMESSLEEVMRVIQRKICQRSQTV